MSEVKPNEPTLAVSRLPVTRLTGDDVRDFVAGLVQEVCDVAPDAITDTARIDHELAMESVQMVQIQVALEQEFDVTLDFLEILRLNAFGPIADYIHRQILEQHTA